MPRFRIFAPCIGPSGAVVRASHDDPVDLDVPVSHGCSRKWLPLDTDAQAMLAKLGVKADIIQPAQPKRPAPPAPGAPAADPGAPDVSEPQDKQPTPAAPDVSEPRTEAPKAERKHRERANDKSPF